MRLGVKTRRLLLALASAAVASAAGAYMSLATPGAVEQLDHLIYDQAVRKASRPEAADSRIVLVDVDDASLEWAYQELNAGWPWPREFHGEMARALRMWGASVVAFDFIFDQTGAGGTADVIAFRDALADAGSVVLGASAGDSAPGRDQPEAGFGLRLGSFDGPDAARVQATRIAASGLTPYILAEGEKAHLFVGGYKDSADGAAYLSEQNVLLAELRPELVPPRAELDRRAWRLIIEARLLPELLPVSPEARVFDPRELAAARFSLGPASTVAPSLRESGDALLPVSYVLTETAALGFVDQRPDRDGIVRRASLVHAWDGNAYPAFSLAMALAATGAAPGSWPEVRLDSRRLRVGEGVIPVGPDGGALIRFHGREPYRRISAWRVLQSAARVRYEGEEAAFDTSIFDGAIVLVGPVASGLMDFKPTPVSNRHVGPDIVAVTVDNILGWLFVRRTAPWVEALWSTALAFLSVLLTMLIGATAGSSRRGGMAGAARFAFRAVLSLTGAVAGISAAYLVALALYSLAGIWPGAAAPILSAGMSVAIFVAAGELLERRDRRQIHDALGTYTSKAVADLVASEGVEALAPRRAEVSVYFSDIAGFTSFSERMPPEALAELLNVYLTAMTDVILEHEGIVDKYIGDAIMAFWGAPAPQPDHALAAVTCGLRMQRRLSSLAPELESTYGVRLVVRAGINSGQVAVGNMGSAQKVNYTLMGDTVNLAARLEGANKSYDTHLMVGEDTWRRIAERILGRELDLLQVKGKDVPVRVYEPLAVKDEPPEGSLAWVDAWEAALGSYRERRFEEAQEGFEEVIRLRGRDGPSQVYLERCRHYLQEPPPSDWNGAFVMTSK